MKKKVIISLSLLLSPLVMALGIRTFDNYQLSLKQNAPLKHPESIVIETLNKGEWQKSRQEVFEYNAERKVLKTIRQQWKQNNWVNQNSMQYRYDQKTGIESERTWGNWVDNSWKPKFRFRSERDGLHRQTTESTEEFKDGSWVLVRKNQSTYDPESGNKKEQIYFNLVDGEWTSGWKDAFSFEGNNLIKKTGYQWFEGQWQARLITNYSYNRNGQRVREITSRINETKETQWRKTNYFLDSNGTKVSSQIYVWKDSVWTDSEKHTYLYNNF